MLASTETPREKAKVFTRLLVAIDGSALAESILPYALGICRATHSQLTLVRVIDDNKQLAQASDYVDALASRLGAEGLCVSAESDVASALLKEAARVPDTLVAMTTHGRSGVLGVLLGSVAMKVLRGGHDPILLFRPPHSFVGEPTDPITITRIVVPMGSGPSAESIGEQAARLARVLGAELVVVSVLDPRTLSATHAVSGDLSESSYVQNRAADLGKRHQVAYSWETLHGAEPDQAIADFVGNDRGTMLAMVTTANAAPITAAMLGSVTTGCLRKAGVPILIRLP